MFDPAIAKLPNDMIDQMDSAVELLGKDISPESFDISEFIYTLGQTMAQIKHYLLIPTEKVKAEMHHRIDRIVSCNCTLSLFRGQPLTNRCERRMLWMMIMNIRLKSGC